MQSFLQDLLYGFRMLLKSPGFTVVAVLTLALGIGANTAIFSVTSALLFRTLPYQDPERLAWIWEKTQGAEWFPVSAANFLDWKDQDTVFEQMAACEHRSFMLQGGNEPEQVPGLLASSNLFNVLGVKASLGRTFLPEDERPGNPRVVVLGHGLWQRRFGADPGILGKTVKLDEDRFTVVGIMPPDFHFPLFKGGAKFWTAELWVASVATPNPFGGRVVRSHIVTARLKPGITPNQAQAEMDLIANRLEQEYPNANRGWGINVTLMPDFIPEERGQALPVLIGALGFVLLIACTNVANLLLARAIGRRREIVVRLTLGASRWRVIRQLLTESLLLAFLGGVFGLLLSRWAIDILVAISLGQVGDIPIPADISIDAQVLGFSIGISVLTGLVFGLMPALAASKPDLMGWLKEGARSSTESVRSNFLRSVLMISEVALALVLLVGATLLIRSFLRLLDVNPGFRPENALAIDIGLPMSRYSDGHQINSFYEELIPRVERLPGVQFAARAGLLPLGNVFFVPTITIDGLPSPSPEGWRIDGNIVSAHYFHAMGIPLLKGRHFNQRDIAQAPTVVIINETMARRFWPNENPIGKIVKSTDDPPVAYEVIGVVGNVKHWGLHADAKPEMYKTFLQTSEIVKTTGLRNSILVVRTESNPLHMSAAIREEIWAIDKGLPITQVRTLDQVVSQSLAPHRCYMVLLGIFAGFALVLAAVGIYGVISYSVSQRTHEMGIRIALGAQPPDMLKLVVKKGMLLAVLGVALGLGGALGLTRALGIETFSTETQAGPEGSSWLYGVTATDPTAFIYVSLILIAVALLACYFPARRATKVDPMVALRYE